MTAPPDFPSYAALADTLIERATKKQLADVARLLALNIGYYQQRYGEAASVVLCAQAALTPNVIHACRSGSFNIR